MTTKIKIGIDFHGVINKNPTYFAELCSLAISKGYEVHIITGGPKDSVIEKLKTWNVEYNYIFAIVDYYTSRGEGVFLENGKFKIDDDLWDIAKSYYCREQGIDIHIDDDLRYFKWFSTPYCYYKNDDKICVTNDGVVIDFSHSAQKTLRDIGRFILR